MIPKIIHYCWFGGNPLPDDAKKCIASWKKHLPDYQIKEWNESNFDINCNKYVREAYDAGKYAFVSDCARLYALVHEGGIYMDTDVEVIGSYDPFLHHEAFSGFENDNYVPTGTMASVKGGKWASDLLEQYDHRSFVKEDGSYDTTSNTMTITKYMLGKGLVQNNQYQDFPGLITLYPSDYFCPKDHRTGVVHLTDNSVCIHHFACSWLPWHVKLRHRLKLLGYRILGQSAMSKIIGLIRKK